jgi:hypothetical protein
LFTNQVHDCEFADNIEVILNETLPTLDSLRQIGKVKYIGITGYNIDILKFVLSFSSNIFKEFSRLTNFNNSLIREIVEKSHIKIDTVLSYCRCTPFDQTLHKYLPFFEACFKKYSLFSLKININNFDKF